MGQGWGFQRHHEREAMSWGAVCQAGCLGGGISGRWSEEMFEVREEGMPERMSL